MGNKTTKFEIPSDKWNELLIKYYESFTGSELTIGNCVRIDINCQKSIGIYSVEKDNYHINIKYNISDLKSLWEHFNNFSIFTPKIKTLNTSGSDAGKSITLEIPSLSLRKEVR